MKLPQTLFVALRNAGQGDDEFLHASTDLDSFEDGDKVRVYTRTQVGVVKVNYTMQSALKAQEGK